MQDLLDFLIEPYKTASAFHIFLEIIAMSFGIASVIFSKRESIWVFPTGIISTSIYIYLLSQWSLYGDLIINIYYTIMSVYGWYVWTKVINDKNDHVPITRMNKKDRIIATGIFIVAASFVFIVYRKFEVMPNLNFSDSMAYFYSNFTSGNLEDFRKITPFIDSFTTASAFVAMWLMAEKKIENWTMWIVTNIFSIPLYFVKGFGFTGIQYIVFLILAILGYQAWKKTLNKKKQTL